MTKHQDPRLSMKITVYS